MPAPAAKLALGATIAMGLTAGAVTVLGEVLSITPPKITREVIAASTLSTTGGMEFISAGLYDGGEISAQLHYIAGDMTDDALVAAMLDGAIRAFRIRVKAATGTEDLTFEGYVTNYGADGLEMDGKQTASLTVKISGDVAQAATV